MKLAAARKSFLPLPSLPKSGSIAGVRHLSGELDVTHKPLPPPTTTSAAVTEIVSVLKTTDHNDWNSNSKLVEFLHTPPSPTSLLKITRQLGSTEKGLHFLEFFKTNSSGLSANPSSLSFTFQAILEQAMRDEQEADVPSKLFELFCFAKEGKIPLSINAATLLIRYFGRAKMLEESVSVYKELDPDSRNTNVVNLLLDCLLRGGNIDRGFKVLDKMLKRDSGVPPNKSTMDIVLSALWKRIWVERRMSVEEICELLVRFFEHGVFLDDVWFTKLITKFCRSRKCDKAWDLLHDMLRLGGGVEASSYNALLSGLGRERDFQRMNLLMNEMKEKEVKPNVVTFGILINHLCKCYRVDEALQVFEKMGGSEPDGVLVKPDRVLYNTLIDGLCKVGKQEEGFKLMEKMRMENGYEPNTVTYNCLIDGFCKAGEIETSLELFDQMKKNGVVPNVITLNILLNGMCKLGRVSSGMGLFAEMQEKGLKGNAITYTILITSFCSVNNIDRAMTLFNEMTAETRPMLCISLSLFELRDAQESAEFVQRPLAPVQSPAQSVETPPVEKDELSALKAGLRKVKIFTEYVSTRRAKKACREEEGSEERCSARSEEGEYAYPFDSDSSDEYEEGESDEGKEDPTVRKSFSYGPLAYTNCAGVSFHSSTRVNGEGEDWVYFSNRRSDVGCSQMDDHITCASDLVVLQNPKRSILPWRKRKLSFRSPKSKGEPLLKKDNGEEGGDDIDFDRRQLSSDESLSFGWHKVEEDSTAHRSSVSEFGDDNFAVGCWEQREIVSRDGHMKLQTQIFFASIDQRSERAAGESACTALVAVLADWLQNNRGLLPIKSQFDSLIREGSLEWRKLCENETYRERFPDKHFDLETVLQAKIRSISVVPGKSFVGFFHPDGMDEGGFDFLHGAMSFDNIWDEISRAGLQYASVNEPQIYIVSWNDHFFVLKVEPEAYYIIDTLGERLYEGCNQAYILKFNKDTAIYKQPNTTHSAEEKPAANQQTISTTPDPKLSDAPHTASGSLDSEAVNVSDEPSKVGSAEEIVCRGKESCKDYIKSFLAAIPIRELQADIKKGLITSTPLHQRLQIELHFTHLQQLQSPITPAIEIATAAQEPPAVAMTEISA